MAVEMSLEASSVALAEATEEVATVAPGADPAVLGLLVFSVGGTVLGVSLLGYVSAAAQGGSVMPIVLAATGLGVHAWRPVIPELRLTDGGLVDVNAFSYVPVEL
jgi:hypothetical protein